MSKNDNLQPYNNSLQQSLEFSMQDRLCPNSSFLEETSLDSKDEVKETDTGHFCTNVLFYLSHPCIRKYILN